MDKQVKPICPNCMKDGLVFQCQAFGLLYWKCSLCGKFHTTTVNHNNEKENAQ